MNKNLQKGYMFLVIIVVLIAVLIWRLSTSFASMDQGYTGKNIISGDKWGVNITKVGEVEKSGNAELIREVSTIGTTLNFSVVLFNPGDKVSFDIEVKNTSILDAELYALTLTGLNDLEGEYITYTILPIDGSRLHGSDGNGSILRSGEKQMFNLTVQYDDIGYSGGEYHLNLGSTLIYKQK